MSPLRGLAQNLVTLLVLLLLVVAWEQGVAIFQIKRYLLPSPTEIGRTMVESWPFLAQHSLATLQTVLAGFLISLALAMLLALSMLLSPALARLMQPLIVVSQTLPTAVTAPLLMVWVGPNMTTKIIATVLNAFFPMVVSLYDGLRSPEQTQVEMLQAAGASPLQIFTKLRLPASMPMLFAGLKVAAISAVTGAVVGELVVGRDGLGSYVRSMAGQLETADVFAGVVMVSVIGVLFYLTIRAMERVIMPWYFIHKDSDTTGGL